MESYRTLFGRNLTINAFDDFSEAAEVDDNLPNATRDCVMLQNFKGSRKSLKIIVS